ncbi:hypothetical protein A6M27_01930 [Acidithiobacillus thiooxidans]|uniref:Uncharacterized protein n=1 Tax=Acidithiobacillus thiooxidans TaxID=930 RepID=A0A1C2IKS1_ACITH|nr:MULTISPECIES: hypothetical protein [Acidithiobacillus]MBU2742354.1 hypothetical protein [Acidithiobacillus albertensis]OCX73517.1 hypothetical protein A6P07_08205 [Acidithiobacillus thiooxidans]OCX76548.1 hypothetical protein A6M23_00005 [Acidithiobacillus thiooxidans]OCX78819.1 hypothetical protein A6O24_03545 [Acidithiobacillus thiooxidans]OCX79929.1 hypothetical protein A6P08_17195 [Acidithiobacillus thiooxidans]
MGQYDKYDILGAHEPDNYHNPNNPNNPKNRSGVYISQDAYSRATPLLISRKTLLWIFAIIALANLFLWMF